VYEDHQLIRVVLSRPPEEVHRESRDISGELGNATNSLVVIDDVRYHVDSQKHLHRDWTDMYLHVVNKDTQVIEDTMQVILGVVVVFVVVVVEGQGAILPIVDPLNYGRCDTKHRLSCSITPFY